MQPHENAPESDGVWAGLDTTITTSEHVKGHTERTEESDLHKFKLWQ